METKEHNDVTQTTHPDLEAMRQTVNRIEAKLDVMPQLYIPRAEYELRHADLVKQVDRHENILLKMSDESKVGKDWAVSEHTKITESMHTVELRIAEKIDTVAGDLATKIEDNNQNWFTMHHGFILWIVSLGIGILTFALNYFMHKP